MGEKKLSQIIEKFELKKEIMKKTSRLNYIKNRDKIIEKSKVRSKTKRKSWDERADNPKNKNKITVRIYYSKLKINLFKNYVYFTEVEK